MGRWLTKEERRTLSPDARRELRGERKLAKWPDTNGKPPWKVALGEKIADIGSVIKPFAQRAAVVLVNAAIEAVKTAALAAINGGQARHEFAVKRLMETAEAEAAPLLREEADALIIDVFDVLEDTGGV